MKLLMATLLLGLGIFAVVVPNSYPLITFGLLLVLGLLAVVTNHTRLLPASYFYMMLASICVTLLYLFIGAARQAPSQAIWQTMTIYILAPVLWSLLAAAALRRFGAATVARALAWLSVPTVLSVAAFFALFLIFGPAAVTVFLERGFVHLQDTIVAARLHVYASLIFLCGGVFAAPDIFRRPTVRLVVVILLLGAVFTSGRSALFLAPPAGLAVLLAARVSGRINIGSVLLGLVAAMVAGVALVLFMRSYGLSTADTLARVGEDLLAGGGTARQEQFRALLDSVGDRMGLGAGHGIGVEVVRSAEHPWRYELVWIATVHRVGIVGALIYALPFLVYLAGASLALLQQRLPVHQRFMLGGFLAAFLSSNTNPYIEGFALQWMFVFPVVDWYANPAIRLRRGGGAARQAREATP